MDRFYALEAKAWVASVAVKKLNNKSFIKGKKSRETIHNALKVLNDLVGDFAQKESSRYEVAREDYNEVLPDRFKLVDTYIDWLLANKRSKKAELADRLTEFEPLLTTDATSWISQHLRWSLMPAESSDSRSSQLMGTNKGVQKRRHDLKYDKKGRIIAKIYESRIGQEAFPGSDLFTGFRYKFHASSSSIAFSRDNPFFQELESKQWIFGKDVSVP